MMHQKEVLVVLVAVVMVHVKVETLLQHQALQILVVAVVLEEEHLVLLAVLVL
jgi:hypothetical protein